jgi:toxin ParE1/3/4
MSGYKIKILQIARQDMVDIYLYILADSPQSAMATIEKIADRMDALAGFPFAGKIVPDNELAKQDYRMLVIDSYIVFYKVIGGEVVVYRVLHGMRDYPDLLK